MCIKRVNGGLFPAFWWLCFVLIFRADKKTLAADIQADSVAKIITDTLTSTKEETDLLKSSPIRSEVPKDDQLHASLSTTNGNSSKFSNAVIKKLRKQLLFVKRVCLDHFCPERL